MNLRPGTAADAEAIAGLIASFQSELTNSPDGAGAEGYLASVSSEAERGYLESDRYQYLVAEDAGELIGFIAMRDVTHVFHMFVARTHQRRGVARQLWQATRSNALVGVASRRFTVNSSLLAVPVYRSFGFEATSEVVVAHGISFLPMKFDCAGEA